MVFSSIPFLFFFLPLCLSLYYGTSCLPCILHGKHFSVKKKAEAPDLPAESQDGSIALKNGILLIFSLVFYAWGEPVYILLMLFASAVDFGNGLMMERFGDTRRKRRFFLICSISINLSVLAFFKYADFAIGTVNTLLGSQIPLLHIGLPIGISFFTFQTMSYIIDLYREEVPAEHNYLTYLTYVSMFPQLVAGPIVRFSTVNQELHRRRISPEGFQTGLFRLMQGLFKKVLIANQAGALWEEIRILETGQASAAVCWLGAAAFTLQLYFDFSAYSDMAIGMGWMLGFHFPENFRYPLWAVSVTDFWRRWHISLSTWFRDYIYIPLGGNRKGVKRHLFNMMVVWFLTGLWHGAAWNFVLWGLYYGILLALEKYIWGKGLERLPAFFRHLYTILIVVTGFVIFVFDDMQLLGNYLLSMAGAAGNAWWGTECIWYLQNYGIVLLAALLLSFPFYPWLCRQRERMGKRGKFLMALGSMAGYISLFLLTTACLVNDTYNPFLYFRF